MNSDRTEPLVSIGIPTYNRANGNLLNVIKRALAQTYQNVEVIVSDNCSSDNTSEVVNSIKDDRLRYIRHESNIGANNNFNHCLKEARGEFFLLFHDDDMIDIDFIESCMSTLEANETVGIIFTGIRLIDGDDKILQEYPNLSKGFSPIEFVMGWFISKITLYLPSTLYNTKLLREVGGFASRRNMYPDLIPTFKLVANYERRDVTEVKASFRRHANNLGSSCAIDGWIEDSLYVLDTLYELFPGDVGLLKEHGKKYFCRKMYKQASAEPKVLKRVFNYLNIYRQFDYCYSPIKHFYGNELGSRILSKLARMLGIRS